MFEDKNSKPSEKVTPTRQETSIPETSSRENSVVGGLRRLHPPFCLQSEVEEWRNLPQAEKAYTLEELKRALEKGGEGRDEERGEEGEKESDKGQSPRGGRRSREDQPIIIPDEKLEEMHEDDRVKQKRHPSECEVEAVPTFAALETGKVKS